MDLRVCDGKDCKNAVKIEGRYDVSGGADRGWTHVERIEVRPSKDEPPQPEPNEMHGEVTVDGRSLPFILHKPVEVAERERATEALYRPRPEVVHVKAWLCPSCSPVLHIKEDAAEDA